MEKKGLVGLTLSGQPVPVKNCNILITQPKVKEILLFGEEEFLTTVFIFSHPDTFLKTIRKGNPQLDHLSDFQLLIVVLSQNEELKNQFEGFCELVFPNYAIEVTSGSIDFKNKEDEEENLELILGQINPFNFQDFQETLSFIFESQVGKEKEYNPANAKAKEIADKLKRGRERIAQQNPNKVQSMLANYASVLSIGMRVSIDVFFNYTIFQLYDAYIRYNKKEAYDYYQRVASMPFMDVSKVEAPEDWFGELYKS